MTTASTDALDSVAGKIVRQPSQQRSRETLRRILDAAELILVSEGDEGFTMAKVATEAGVSTGILYSNFSSKQAMVNAVKDIVVGTIETAVSEAMRRPTGSLESAIHAYAGALAAIFEKQGRLLGVVIYSPDKEAQLRGSRTWNVVRAAYEEALIPFVGDVKRAEPLRSIRFTFQTITATMIHTSASGRTPEESWSALGDELAEMAIAYLGGDR